MKIIKDMRVALERDELSDTSALVIDDNQGSRAILVNQLREFGIGSVEQVMRLAEARRVLEHRKFDVVLCEQYFQSDEGATGQDLINDLRRNQLLPFSTVFIMITSEASYSKVAEAAESALDGYIIKPHTASKLAASLHQARQRKVALAEIFAAIESEQYETAARLCLERFKSRGPSWLYATRIGAELLIRLERYDEAQKLYEAVAEAKTLPWAKLGIARAQMGMGQTERAVGTLESLIGETPHYADAYDVLGRAQFELGRSQQTLAAYRIAVSATPHSLSRLQSLGHLLWYNGEREEADRILARCVIMGLDSKTLDPQTMVLLAIQRFVNKDRKGLVRQRDDLNRSMGRHEDSPRVRRMFETAAALVELLDAQYARTLKIVRDHVTQIGQDDFDAEAGANLVALVSLYAANAPEPENMETVLDQVHRRFGAKPSVRKLLVGAAFAHPLYAKRLQKMAE